MEDGCTTHPDSINMRDFIHQRKGTTPQQNYPLYPTVKRTGGARVIGKGERREFGRKILPGIRKTGLGIKEKQRRFIHFTLQKTAVLQNAPGENPRRSRQPAKFRHRPHVFFSMYLNTHKRFILTRNCLDKQGYRI
jgi:hypothetical protein